jgi:hypothetical protein
MHDVSLVFLSTKSKSSLVLVLALEVTIDVPNPPTVTIISPTPRAFTFPIPHKPIEDSPYTSPSHSPFEPDLRSLALTCTPPPAQHLIGTMTASTSAPSSLMSQHKRRNSSSCDGERRPKKGDEDYIKRPENAFILFRRKCCEDRQQAHDEAASSVEGPIKKQRQADLSKTISQQWKSLPSEERQYWEDLAKEKKKEHEHLYPNYVYRPQRTKGKEDKLKGKKSGKCSRRGSEIETESDSLSFVLPIPSSNRHGRSASAPTPPLAYQQITMPNVYMPSCPTSPSLLPMIARRASHPGHQPVVSHFDYLPITDTVISSAYPAQFDSSLLVSGSKMSKFT